jgi:putative membrane protein
VIALLPLVAVALAYAAGVRRARRWPARRTAAFAAGLAMLAIALAALDGAAGRELRAHMVQHLLIVVVAAPLLVLGAPVQLALRAGVPGVPAMGALVHPAVGWTALTATTLATHLTGVYDLALRSPPVHALEHTAYLWSALLFWLPLAGAAPLPNRPGPFGRMLWILAAMPPMSAVAAWLGDAQQPVYAHYAHTLGSGALADQSAAAALMAVGGTAPLALAAVLLTMEALWREEARQRRRETLGATS